MKANSPQITGVTYIVSQKRRESVWFKTRFYMFENKVCQISKLTSRDSKIHTFVPSSWISFHHLRPTNNRPVTFFTVQKSKASKSTRTTNNKTELLKKLPNRYIKTAANLKRKWKTNAIGCALCCNKLFCRGGSAKLPFSKSGEFDTEFCFKLSYYVNSGVDWYHLVYKSVFSLC